MILDIHRQGLSMSDIARRAGLDRKMVRKYIARGLEPPAYKPRKRRALLIDEFAPYLGGRLASYPELSGRGLWREARELGFKDGYTSVTGFLHDIRPAAPPGNSETPRSGSPTIPPAARPGDAVGKRPLEFYKAVGRRLAGAGLPG